LVAIAPAPVGAFFWPGTGIKGLLNLPPILSFASCVPFGRDPSPVGD
jgi:hypothetical protein